MSRLSGSKGVSILYNHRDGSSGAEQLYRSLTQAGLDVWIEGAVQPVEAAEGAAKSRQSLTAAADAALLLLVTPAALTDEDCRQRLQQTAPFCRAVLPVLWGEIDIDAWQHSPLYEVAAQQPVLEGPLVWSGGEIDILVQHLLPRLVLPHQPSNPSLAAPAIFYDAFISYGRADSKAFAVNLHQWLSDRGHRVWFDQNDIPLGVDYQKQIDEGIVCAHNFIFVISPHAVNSPYCALEMAQALRFNKRIIPLMHVEAIDRSTWQKRYPDGTETDWQTYQQQGLHSSLINLNRAVSRLNWIFCREGIDDLAGSFQSLLDLFYRDRDYVDRHTTLLTQALDWERQQRQSSSLLIGPARSEARTWLLQRFADRQPPCLPTSIHAEYICESQKYADQWMTQVFLAYADADRERQEHIRLSLMLAGVTVWSSRTDIQSGKDFQAEINRGIENADNLVVLLSPQALRSHYCLREISYAFELNKRVIPLLIEPVDLVEMGQTAGLSQDAAATLSRLHQLQFIDLSQVQDGELHRQGLDQLQKRLRDSAQYFREHKELLVQALKWQRQQRNPSILLRGSTLRYYEAWIKLAAQRQEQMPTALQHQFLQESLQQPTDSTLDVFLLGAPEDLAFVRKLNDILQVQGKTTWALSDVVRQERNSAEETRRGLEQCQNVVLILSPSWFAAVDCQQELAVALSLNKRIIPVLYRPVVPSKVPEVLAKLPRIDFHRSGGDFLSTFGELYRLLESEPEHVRGHTQLLVRAKTWEEAGRDDSYLLRGRELKAAEDWLRQAGEKAPQPIALQQDLIEASQALPRRRLKVRSLLSSAAVVTVLVFVVRLLGGLQPLELMALDVLLKLRPSEAQDDRFLLVEVDSQSGDWLREQMKAAVYTPGIGTVPDGALEQTLAILEENNAALIGLDFYRDFAAEPAAAQRLRSADNLIGLCKASNTPAQGELQKGVEKPPEVPLERVGFNDLVRDDAQHLRRHSLKQAPDPSFCNTEDSFSLQLARAYLARQNVSYTDPWNSEGAVAMQFGQVKVPELWAGGIFTSESAGYTPLGSEVLGGYQTLINFRAYQGDVWAFAPTVSLVDLLNGQVPRDQIENRIVLIGYADRTDRNADYHNTPYGQVPGLVMQGQMTSQLISAALDGRPLIWWWPIWGETLWILGWAGIGGLLVWGAVRPGQIVLASIGGTVLLCGVCYGLLAGVAGWVPLIPAGLAGFGSGSVVVYLTHRIRHP
ncbi:MAG: TIR domain-containing protein [Cyanobacteria bacterium Co-bin13]|nr:TIR domain-containing protein [Cyanobacteria bacterium Co-bin13]